MFEVSIATCSNPSECFNDSFIKNMGDVTLGEKTSLIIIKVFLHYTHTHTQLHSVHCRGCIVQFFIVPFIIEYYKV